MSDSPVLDLRSSRVPRAIDLPARFRERVLAALPGAVERIVLFGSQARGDARHGSDWDFAVFLTHEPDEDDQRRMREIDSQVWQEFGTEVQALVLAGTRWLASDELACNIRDHGLIIYGPDGVPMIERPVLQHARDALAKAERFAKLADETADERYEGVVHGAYYAMFHAARTILLLVEGSASTNHGQVVETFAKVAKRRRLGRVALRSAAQLTEAYKLRIKADYGNEDLTEAGRRLREAVTPFLALARSLVDEAPG